MGLGVWIEGVRSWNGDGKKWAWERVYVCICRRVFSYGKEQADGKLVEMECEVLGLKAHKGNSSTG